MTTNHREAFALNDSDLGYALLFCAEHDAEGDDRGNNDADHPRFYMTRTATGGYRAPLPCLVERERDYGNLDEDEFDVEASAESWLAELAHIRYHSREHHRSQMSACHAPGFEPTTALEQGRRPRRYTVVFSEGGSRPQRTAPAKSSPRAATTNQRQRQYAAGVPGAFGNGKRRASA